MSASHRTCEDSSVSTRPMFSPTPAAAQRVVLCHRKKKKLVSQARPNFLPKATCQRNSFHCFAVAASEVIGAFLECLVDVADIQTIRLTKTASDTVEVKNPEAQRVAHESLVHRQEILHAIDVVHETSRANTVSLVASLKTVIGSSSLRRFASSSSVRPIQRCTSTPLLSRKPQEATTTWCYCLFRQSSKNGHILVFCTWALMIFSFCTSNIKCVVRAVTAFYCTSVLLLVPSLWKPLLRHDCQSH